MSQTPTDASISTRVLTTIIILLIAVWTLVCAAVLIGFHGATSGALGAGVEDEAGQRLLGAHMLILVPAYLLLAWRPDRYQAFLWLPLASQAATALAVGYSLLTGETSFGDGILALAISAFFVVLLGFVWVSEQRTVARIKYEAGDHPELAAADPTPFREP